VTFSGVIRDPTGLTGPSGDITKAGSGTVVLTGANSYAGATVVDGGTLVAAGTAGGALASTTAITVNADGNLTLGASDQINNAAPITLAGGTLSKGDFSEGTSSSAGAGALNLAADGSQIDFGSGTPGTLAFAIFNPDSYSVSVDNWTGTPGAIGSDSTDRLIFASDPSANLDRFFFTGYDPGAVALMLGGGFWEVTPEFTPVPEINPVFAAAGMCALGVFLVKRKSRRERGLIG
jgi:autotransporter-associated beta strand protein